MLLATYAPKLRFIIFIHPKENNRTWRNHACLDWNGHNRVFLNAFQEGGPIGLIKNGDIIKIDVQNRRIDVELTDEELENRRKNWTSPPYKASRGVLYKVRSNTIDRFH